MSDIPSILRKILQTKTEEIELRQKQLGFSELAARVAGLPPCRGFASRVEAHAEETTAVIAEGGQVTVRVGDIGEPPVFIKGNEVF